MTYNWRNPAAAPQTLSDLQVAAPRRLPPVSVVQGAPALAFHSQHALGEWDEASAVRLAWHVRRRAAVAAQPGAPSLSGQADRSLIFDAIQALYLSTNRPRDRQIADRLAALWRDALDDEEPIRAASVWQFKGFFIEQPDLRLPIITLTPDGTLRARWMRAPDDFLAIEFTGRALVRIVAKIPRDGGETAEHFGNDTARNAVTMARDLGAPIA